VVIFSNFRDPLELLERRFEKAGISYIHMKQKDNDQERLKKWAFDFPKLQHQVFMSTLQLGSESINLTPARHVIFLDRSWSPKDNSQGIGRIRRPGQKGQPVVININARKTVDQYIEKVVTEKQGWFRDIFHDDDDEGDNGN
jgi:SNF2 family DNA or RNA helicase